MGLNVEDMIAGLDPAERRKVEDLAAEFIAEEMTLRELRKARKLTQAGLAVVISGKADAGYSEPARFFALAELPERKAR